MVCCRSQPPRRSRPPTLCPLRCLPLHPPSCLLPHPRCGNRHRSRQPSEKRVQPREADRRPQVLTVNSSRRLIRKANRCYAARLPRIIAEGYWRQDRGRTTSIARHDDTQRITCLMSSCHLHASHAQQGTLSSKCITLGGQPKLQRTKSSAGNGPVHSSHSRLWTRRVLRVHQRLSPSH